MILALSLLTGSARADLDAEEQSLRETLKSRQAEMETLLCRLVEINTGTFHREGLERFAALWPPLLAQLGFRTELLPGAVLEVPGRPATRSGPLVVAQRTANAGDGHAPRLLLVGHYDTVFEPDAEFGGCRLDGARRATGPGVADMKGGLVVMLFALRALEASHALDRAHWTVILNADEEIGSLGSRVRIEKEARRADFGFVFEAARHDGAMVRSRRGLGQFHLEVTGVGAHAGNAHAEGRSAIAALAEKVLRIEALTDYRRGVTLNVGTIRGGTKRNIVPERAEAWIDLRYDRHELGEEARAALQAIAAETSVAGTQARLWGLLHRPPKPETQAGAALLARHAAAAADLGLVLPPPIHSGGGTDGSLMGAVGLATLDSMGVIGGGAHTTGEFVELPSLSERASLAAVLWRRLALPDPTERVD